MCKEFEMIPAELWPSGRGLAQDVKILHLMPSSEKKKKFPQQSLARGKLYVFYVHMEAEKGCQVFCSVYLCLTVLKQGSLCTQSQPSKPSTPASAPHSTRLIACAHSHT